MFSSGNVDAVTFFSPSAVKSFIEALTVLPLCQTTVAVIGPTTAEAVRSAGAEAHVVSESATAKSLAEALSAYFTRSPHPTSP